MPETMSEVVNRIVKECDAVAPKEERANRVSQHRAVAIRTLLDEASLEMHRASFFLVADRAVEMRSMAKKLMEIERAIAKLSE